MTCLIIIEIIKMAPLWKYGWFLLVSNMYAADWHLHHVKRGRIHQCQVQVSCHLHVIVCQSKYELLHIQGVGDMH